MLFAGRSDRVSEFLAAADVLVLPSRFEPFGMVVVEAMLMGVPPIVSKACGASEVIEHDVDGFVLDSANDVPSWTAALTTAIKPEKRKAMSDACLARREGFGYEAHLRDIEVVYARAKR
ncbi:MAG: glycosyltransferase family 4 protein [Tepidisphaeraceae bacterium]